jgi:hypothetical protein
MFVQSGRDEIGYVLHSPPGEYDLLINDLSMIGIADDWNDICDLRLCFNCRRSQDSARLLRRSPSHDGE